MKLDHKRRESEAVYGYEYVYEYGAEGPATSSNIQETQ
jgi:hypothetical protein